MITWNQWLNWACSKLTKSLSPRRDAEILLKNVVKKSNTQLLAFGETRLKYAQFNKLNVLIRRRIQGEPIAYLIGVKEFWSLKLIISPGVFIPRSDTECLVEQILKLIPNSHLQVLDLGTGIGNIALALASERPNWNIIGIDCQNQALILAYKNKLMLKNKNVNFMYGNWFKHLQEKKFNIIVSNPPYINEHDLFWLDSDISFEPKHALISKYLGLSDLIEICKHAPQYLYPYGWLFLEHGWDQGKFIRNFLNLLKFTHVSTSYDYHQCERVTYGQWKPSN